MAAIQVQLRQSVEDPAQSLWVHLLPPIKGQSILKAGASRSDNLRALYHLAQRPITCIGEGVVACGDAQLVRPRCSSELPREQFDVAVLDEPDYLLRLPSAKARHAEMEAICAALRPGGHVLFCFPVGNLGLRRTVEHFLRRDFESPQEFLCDPDALRPQRIVPHSGQQAWATQYLNSSSGNGAGMMQRIRKTAKWALYSSSGRYNPRYGLVLVGRKKPCGASSGPSLYERLLGLAQQRLEAQAPHVVLSAEPHNGKQFFFLFDGAALAGIAKYADKRYPRAGLLERELKNLELAAGARLFRERVVAFSQLVHREEEDGKRLFIARAVPGKPLAELVRSAVAQQDRARVEGWLREGFRLAAQFHEEMTRDLAGRAPLLDPAYFQPYPGSAAGELGIGTSPLVQHGDFVLEHIFYEAGTRHPGLIDFEWMGSGFPPLLDLFSLVRSFGFVERGHKRRTSEVAPSFADTFFAGNWFSELAAGLISAYCAKFGIDERDIFQHFLGYLLFRCNKCRLDDALWPDQLAVWEAMLRYAVEHRESFSLSMR